MIVFERGVVLCFGISSEKLKIGENSVVVDYLLRGHAPQQEQCVCISKGQLSGKVVHSAC